VAVTSSRSHWLCSFLCGCGGPSTEERLRHPHQPQLWRAHALQASIVLTRHRLCHPPLLRSMTTRGVPTATVVFWFCLPSYLPISISRCRSQIRHTHAGCKMPVTLSLWPSSLRETAPSDFAEDLVSKPPKGGTPQIAVLGEIQKLDRRTEGRFAEPCVRIAYRVSEWRACART
jgi:hypothetical protein